MRGIACSACLPMNSEYAGGMACSLGAGTLLGLQGLGTVYMEVLSIPPIKNMRRPVVESLFTVSDANANCVGGVAAC